MSQIIGTIARTGDAVSPLALNTAPILQQHDPGRLWGEDNWENEGGQTRGTRVLAVAAGPCAGDVERLAAQVLILETTLSTDFVNGRIGTRHNTYAHRSRVLRQQKGKLEAMRVSYLSKG